jgi:DNA-binding transcriptional LysR family regulator
MQHLVVSLTGDPHGFVDNFLAQQGRTRRIALTVPNFMFALAVVAEGDLISALPRRFAVMYGPKFGVINLEPPLPLRNFRVNAVASQAAMMDEGVTWLFGVLQKMELVAQKTSRRASPKKKQQS